MKNLLLFLPTILMLLSSCSKKEPILKIGLVADPQYADQPTAGERYYRESLWKLEEAIDTFNYNKVDFVQSLGDIIDGKWESYDSILPIYDKLNPDIGNYHLLGNHDFSIDSAHFGDLLDQLSMPDFYYSYSKKGWRFIVLDASDYAYYSNAIHQHDINQVDDYFDGTKDKPNHHPWNGAIGNEQQRWIKQQLDSATLLNEKVIVFSHLPVRPKDNPHNLWNDEEIIKLLESRGNVQAFINGHNHAGNYDFINGIHYITIFGMVDTMISSYGMLEIYQNSLVLRGYGNQKTVKMNYE